ncbi:MAG: ABC transporter ATP-binding protein [Planctomycetes bacterium]|nr:ABC transporter ATP-binding protein [Planctomycetota bacterium]
MDAAPIVFRNVHRRFDKTWVLRGLDFEVPQGSVYALLGRNGCGKTTAIRTLLGFLLPHQGEAQLLGESSEDLSAATRGRVAYVTEGHRLQKLDRIKDILAFEAGTRPSFSLPRARAWIERLGLDPKKRVLTMSRGQRAQVALVAALSADPEVLILDDPGLGLDVVMRRELLDALIQALTDTGCTVLLSSHVMTDVERIADRVGILHGGALIADSEIDELKQRIERRFWQPNDPSEGPPPLLRVLRARRVPDGYDLTLLDVDDDLLDRLRSAGAFLGDPVCLGLEELFLDLVAADAEAPAPAEVA